MDTWRAVLCPRMWGPVLCLVLTAPAGAQIPFPEDELAACELHLLERHTGPQAARQLDDELEAFISLSERALSYRAGTIAYYRLEKTPFRLTDQFIPGHWGHVAIWIGGEAELKALGIWEHELLKPHQAAIRRGHGVVEALRSGVTLSSLRHFLNVDDLAVLRSRNLSGEARAQTVLQAMRQVGKAYDFNFDVETTDRIVCSELVYVTYTDQVWPTQKTLGRSTISPDQVASRLYQGDAFELVLFYHDGRPVTAQPLQTMQRLMHYSPRQGS